MLTAGIAVASVIYLEAFIPDNNTSFSDLNPEWNEKGPLVQVPKMERSPIPSSPDADERRGFVVSRTQNKKPKPGTVLRVTKYLTAGKETAQKFGN